MATSGIRLRSRLLKQQIEAPKNNDLDKIMLCQDMDGFYDCVINSFFLTHSHLKNPKIEFVLEIQVRDSTRDGFNHDFVVTKDMAENVLDSNLLMFALSCYFSLPNRDIFISSLDKLICNSKLQLNLPEKLDDKTKKTIKKI